jgi:hypothetical protein
MGVHGMKKSIRKSIVTATLIVSVLGSAMTVYAAPKTMADGTIFDAEYYAQANPDVVAALGTDENVLYQHYVTYGQYEGRLPYDSTSTETTTTISATTSAKPVTQETLDAANKKHNYYKKLSSDYVIASEQNAQWLAEMIMSNPELTTDYDKVAYATYIIAGVAAQLPYGRDSAGIYRSPASIFCTENYTCAGATRALGRVLDYMGYEWEHTYENQNHHQWCVLTMDGQVGYADGMAGLVGYGTHMAESMTQGSSYSYFVY